MLNVPQLYLIKYLHCFQFFSFVLLFCFAIIDNGVNIIHIDLNMFSSLSWVSVLGRELLNFRVCIYSNPTDNNKFCSRVDMLIHTSPGIAHKFLLLYSFASTWYCQICKFC